jgi:type II secretory pathway pseudopilin PulG
MHVGKKNSRSEAGFNVVELVVVMAIILICLKFAVVGMQSAQKTARNQTALTTVVEQMRYARQLAIDKRMVHIITFCGTALGCTVPGIASTVAVNTITIQSKTNAATPVYTTISTTLLPFDIAFAAPGVAAAPDNFGTGAVAMEFDCPTTGTACPTTPANFIWFYPDGSGKDAVGNINNAVIYMSRASDTSSLRAVTLFGATGRIKGWLKVGGTWQ